MRRREAEPSRLAAEERKAWIGRRGVSVSSLAPGGRVRIDDEKRDAIAECGVIDRDVGIEVVRKDGHVLVVRVDDSENGG